MLWKRSSLRLSQCLAFAVLCVVLFFFSWKRQPTPWLQDSELLSASAGENIFFVKFGVDKPVLRGDELCGMESAARAHPDATLVILTTASFNSTQLDHLQWHYGHRIRLLSITNFVHALEERDELPGLLAWYRDGTWRQGFPLNNLSNGFRIALVYHYGGRYFDLDILHVRSSLKLYNTMVWEETQKRLNNAVFIFDHKHPFLRDLSGDFVRHFNGSAWGNNGPLRVTLAYARVCPNSFNKTAQLTRPGVDAAYCGSIRTLDSESYYPLHYTGLTSFLTTSRTSYLDSDAIYGVHVWSSFPKRGVMPQLGSSLHALAQHVCPRTLELHGLDAFAEHADQSAAHLQQSPMDLPPGL